jgi:hypothetical protein
MKLFPEGLYPLWEVPLGGGRIGFVNAPLTSSEFRNFKRELKITPERSSGYGQSTRPISRISCIYGPN